VRQGEVEEVGIGDAGLAIETDESQNPLMVIEAVHGTLTLPERNLKENQRILQGCLNSLKSADAVATPDLFRP
jgi:hypothetical protein